MNICIIIFTIFIVVYWITHNSISGKFPFCLLNLRNGLNLSLIARLNLLCRYKNELDLSLFTMNFFLTKKN